MGQYPVGNQVNLLFAFTSRQLTSGELQTFLSGGGLPTGVGVDQTAVRCDYQVNGGQITTLTGASIVHDAVGAYHATITLAVPNGTYRYRGYSLDGSSNPVAATPTNTIVATPAF